MSEWRRPSACSSTSCIEVREWGGMFEIRTATWPNGQMFASPEEWAAFVAAVKAGEFDDLS